MAFGGYDGSIKIDTSINSKNFNSGISKIGASLKGLAGAVGVAFGVAALIRFSKEAVKLASNLEEVQNVVDVTFGAGNAKIEAFATSAIENFGLSELAAKKYVSTLGSMGSAIGLASTQNEDMSISLTKLIGDFSSFKNVTSEEAFTAMSAVYTGETETLKKYGILITDVNLQEYAKTQGISKSITKMTQQEKVMLRYNYLLKQTQLMQGDFVRTQDSWANQTRVLSERWKQFLGLMGTGLIQALTPALKFLNVLLAGLMKFATAFSKVTAAIFGKQTLASSISDTAEATASAAYSQQDYADATASAAAEQDNFLSGLDEINKASAPTDSATASSTSNTPAISGLSGEIGSDVTVSPALQNVIDEVTGFFDKFKSIDLAPAKEALSSLGDALKPFASSIGEGLTWFWDNILVPLGTWVIEDGVPAFLDFLSGAIKEASAQFDAAKEVFKWLWDNFLQPIAVWTGGVIVSVLESLGEKLSAIGSWISEHQKGFEDFILIIASFAAAWVLVNAAVSIWHTVCAIATAVTTAFGTAVAFLTSPIGIVIIAIGLLIAIVILCVKHWDDIKAAASAAWDWIKEIWGKASSWLKDNVVTPISNFFSGMWDGIKKAFTTVFDFIKQAFKGYINGYITVFETFINFFIKGINLLVSGLNKINFDVPDWVPAIGGKTFGFNVKAVPEIAIPRLATGAVIPAGAEFAAILGDQKNGRNLEAPEGLIRQIVKEESASSLTIIVQMPDGSQKEVYSVSNITKANRQSGKILIPVEV